ncbi:MAG: hypothetical protein HQL38_02425 [Alphaproteobacteria bacterium]|nr:hypothetical protein [Alphaproteobacteria bacterium]
MDGLDGVRAPTIAAERKEINRLEGKGGRLFASIPEPAIRWWRSATAGDVYRQGVTGQRWAFIRIRPPLLGGGEPVQGRESFIGNGLSPGDVMVVGVVGAEMRSAKKKHS